MKKVQTKAVCIFCGGAPLSETHIWPNWLRMLLQPNKVRYYDSGNDLDEVGKPSSSFHQASVMQGSIFNQKPKLACVSCNNSWMNIPENKVREFAMPLLTRTDSPVILSGAQQKDFALWCALIGTLAEYMDKKFAPVVTEAERKYIYRYKQPPRAWTINVASMDCKRWKARYNFQKNFMQDFGSNYQFAATVRSLPRRNTMVATFGMGHLLMQLFVSSHQRSIYHYRKMSRQAGFTTIWPPEIGWLPWSVKKATIGTRVFDDGQADAVAKMYTIWVNRVATHPEEL